MTYGALKHLVNGLLIGDNALSKNEDEVLMLLSYAYNKIANEADALKLFLMDSTAEPIIRQGPGRTFIRKPYLPTADTDELDIDDDLGYVAARFICSFVSREKGGIHVSEAMNLIRAYNQKVQAFIENLEQDMKLDDYEDQDMYGKRKYE